MDRGELERRLSEKNRDSIREGSGIPKEAVVVGSVSRLVEDKGHAFLIEAVRKLCLDFPDIFLLMAGDGREKKDLEAMVWRYGLSLHVKIIPGTRDVASLLSIMDIFAHPATYREGFGLSVAEAMIAKIPVIVTDIPAINTIIQDRVNGLVVPPKNADALAGAIGFLIKNPDESRILASRGYEMAKDICRLDRMADQTEQVYRKAIGSWKKV